MDAHGNLFIANTLGYAILEVNASTGAITTVAGNGMLGYTGDGGPATSGELNAPQGVAVDGHGNIFIADYENNVVREVNASTGMITTVAGNGTLGSTGDGGPATSAELSPPHSVAVDSEGNLFIAADDDVIREVNASTGIITTVVGNGMQGYSGDGGPATAAELNDPSGIAFDSHGDLFIADMYNDVVREVAGLSPPTSTQGPPPNQTPPPTPPPVAKLERVGPMNVRTGKNKTTEVIELHFSEG